VLFEIATDGPGFTADEAAGALGTRLMLPPWLEAQRPHIEETLPSLRLPGLVKRAA
jgi:glyoxalase family protein